MAAREKSGYIELSPVQQKLNRLHLVLINSELKTHPSVERVTTFLLEEECKTGRREWTKHFKAMDDWKIYFDLNPEWQGLSTKGIQEHTSDGGKAFYKAFMSWTGKEVAHIPEPQLRKDERQRLISTIFPRRQRDWSGFTALEQWQDLFEKNLQWHGLSTKEVSDHIEDGGSSFYKAFGNWTHQSVAHIAEPYKRELTRKALFESIFSPRHMDWSNFSRIEDWQEYFKQHPEWEGLPTSKIEQYSGNGFYQAFRVWTLKAVAHIVDPQQRRTERKKLVEVIFPPRKQDWTGFTTIEQWQEYFYQHPQWIGLTTNEIGKSKSDGCAFYSSFTVWTRRAVAHISDPQLRKAERKKLVESIFPPRHHDWTDLTTIEQWRDFYNKNPQWQNLLNKGVNNKESGELSKFYGSFICWVNKKVDPIHEPCAKRDEYRRLVKVVFPYNKMDWSSFTTLEQWQEYYNQHPEWHGLSKKERIIYRENGCEAFSMAFRNWTNGAVVHISNPQLRKAKRREIVETIFPNPQMDWTGFTTPEQWREYFNQHPEWRGQSAYDIKHHPVDGIVAFRTAFLIWTKKEAACLAEPQLRNAERRRLVETIFPYRQTDWSGFTTLEQWQEYFNQHPDWRTLSTTQISGSKSDGCAFYSAFMDWTKKAVAQIPDHQLRKAERKKIIEVIFPPRRQDWSGFTTLKQWQEYFYQQSEWRKLSLSEIKRDIKNGGCAFYASFIIWTRKMVGEIHSPQLKKIERRKLIETIFPVNHQDWSVFTTLEHWQEYFNQHPKWFGMSTNDIRNSADHEVKNFYHAFTYWTRTIAKDYPENIRKRIRKELYQVVFRDNQSDEAKDLERTEISLDIDFNNYQNSFLTVHETMETDNPDLEVTHKNTNRVVDGKLDLMPKTAAERFRHKIGQKKDRWNDDQLVKAFIEAIDQLPTFAIHRAGISFLLNYFGEKKMPYPSRIADFGSGPSLAFEAYLDSHTSIDSHQLSFGAPPPLVVDIDSSMSMLDFGGNPNKIYGDITQEIPEIEAGSFSLVQCSFVLQRMSPEKVLSTLIEARRILSDNGYIFLVSPKRFSRKFFDGLRVLSFDPISVFGDRFGLTTDMLSRITHEKGIEAAERLREKMKHSFFLFAQKKQNDNPHTAEEAYKNFVFDYSRTFRKQRTLNVKRDNKPHMPIKVFIELVRTHEYTGKILNFIRNHLLSKDRTIEELAEAKIEFRDRFDRLMIPRDFVKYYPGIEQKKLLAELRVARSEISGFLKLSPQEKEARRQVLDIKLSRRVNLVWMSSK